LAIAKLISPASNNPVPASVEVAANAAVADPKPAKSKVKKEAKEKAKPGGVKKEGLRQQQIRSFAFLTKQKQPVDRKTIRSARASR
jgi:hypothetical protein